MKVSNEMQADSRSGTGEMFKWWIFIILIAKKKVFSKKNRQIFFPGSIIQAFLLRKECHCGNSFSPICRVYFGIIQRKFYDLQFELHYFLYVKPKLTSHLLVSLKFRFMTSKIFLCKKKFSLRSVFIVLFSIINFYTAKKLSSTCAGSKRKFSSISISYPYPYEHLAIFTKNTIRPLIFGNFCVKCTYFFSLICDSFFAKMPKMWNQVVYRSLFIENTRIDSEALMLGS